MEILIVGLQSYSSIFLHVRSAFEHGSGYWNFLGVGKNFDYFCTRTFFSLPFNENFSNCTFDFYQILHSHSTLRVSPACAMTPESQYWEMRNIAYNDLNFWIFQFLIFLL